MASYQQQLILLCPEAKVDLRDGKIVVTEKIHLENEEKCTRSIEKLHTAREVEGTKYLSCWNCKGNGHDEVEYTRPIKHPLHPKHALIFGMSNYRSLSSRKCYCCEESLDMIVYCCPSCDFAINITCLKKPPCFVIEYPKRHEHTLSLFTRQAPITCNVCALDRSSHPIYMCPPCDYVVHKSCIYLPWVIKISRHHHRISFTSSFGLEDLICGVCRRNIDSDFGGYCCDKEGCSYAAHSKCATREDLWDGKELDGESDDIDEEEVLGPFVRISDEIIQHFMHQHHHMKLHKTEEEVYDENKYCQACIIPIFYGNFYSCVECAFILHQTCANLSPKIYHALHPHPLTLVEECDQQFLFRRHDHLSSCSACYQHFELHRGFIYKCSSGCNFRLHIQCATISEPLIHGSHADPLYLTSRPGEHRNCSICKDISRHSNSKQTFNCIKCDFSLCFKCATLPEKTRYKHDKHILTLLYREENNATKYWCEICETELDPRKRFYSCEDCSVTLHIECLLGNELYKKPGSTTDQGRVAVLLNNRMDRLICKKCHKRCQHNIVFQRYGFIFCSSVCFRESLYFLLYNKLIKR